MNTEHFFNVNNQPSVSEVYLPYNELQIHIELPDFEELNELIPINNDGVTELGETEYLYEDDETFCKEI